MHHQVLQLLVPVVLRHIVFALITKNILQPQQVRAQCKVQIHLPIQLRLHPEAIVMHQPIQVKIRIIDEAHKIHNREVLVVHRHIHMKIMQLMRVVL